MSNVVTVLMGTVCAVLQLRQWQQHMQEQLKAHQLEELVRLQEEQQRLLGMVHVAQQDGAGTENTLTLYYCCVIAMSLLLFRWYYSAIWMEQEAPVIEFDTPDLDKTVWFPTDYIETSRLTGADWREGTLLGDAPLSQSSPTAQSFPIGPPQGPASSQLWRQGPTFQQPPRGQEQEGEDQDRTLGWKSAYWGGNVLTMTVICGCLT